MMHYGYGSGFGGGADVFGVVITLVVLADLILLGVWLWKKIASKE
jgi:hypothetical protein